MKLQDVILKAMAKTRVKTVSRRNRSHMSRSIPGKTFEM